MCNNQLVSAESPFTPTLTNPCLDPIHASWTSAPIPGRKHDSPTLRRTKSPAPVPFSATLRLTPGRNQPQMLSSRPSILFTEANPNVNDLSSVERNPRHKFRSLVGSVDHVHRFRAEHAVFLPPPPSRPNVRALTRLSRGRPGRGGRRSNFPQDSFILVMHVASGFGFGSVQSPARARDSCKFWCAFFGPCSVELWSF